MFLKPLIFGMLLTVRYRQFVKMVTIPGMRTVQVRAVADAPQCRAKHAELSSAATSICQYAFRIISRPLSLTILYNCSSLQFRRPFCSYSISANRSLSLSLCCRDWSVRLEILLLNYIFDGSEPRSWCCNADIERTFHQFRDQPKTLTAWFVLHSCFPDIWVWL